jgi:iron complex transport system substrate-binding protein
MQRTATTAIITGIAGNRAEQAAPANAILFNMYPPTRIVCLTEETTETLYLLGEQHRIVGISGYTVRPPHARKEKLRVSAFISADVPKILALEPDLVLTFSDLQADIVAALVRAGVPVHAFNQRSVAGILDMIRTLGALIGAGDRANALAQRLAVNVDSTRRRAAGRGWRPKVYFEEWDDPMISGIGWVSELISVAGGTDVFAELASYKSAKDRIVNGDDVISRSPDVIVGSWCGKKFNKERVAARPGFDAVPAVQNRRLYEVKSALILQPGPAALTDGLAALENIIANSLPAS